MQKKDPLGKGLSAILKDIEEKGTTRLIPAHLIKANPEQPRFEIKEESLLELAQSIKEKGLLQPIIVKRKEGLYEIVAGERRFRASQMAGLNEIPAIIKDVDRREALEIALIENLLREDLNPVEVALSFGRFIEEFGYTHQELGKRLGLDRSSISNYLRLLKLPEWVKKLIAEGKLTQGHARVLVSLKNEKDQERFVEKILKESTSVREIEREAKKKVKKTRGIFDQIEDNLREALKTKVHITFRKNKGKIIIEFYSKEDLKRIVESIAQNR